MISPLFLVSSLLVATIASGLPLKPTSLDTSINFFPVRDINESAGPLIRRGEKTKAERVVHKTSNPYITLEQAKQPTRSKIASIVKKVIYHPKKTYKDNIAGGNWRETLRKGGIDIGSRKKTHAEPKVHQTSNPYVTFVEAKQPLRSKIVEVSKKVINDPKQMYKDNIEGGKWRDTLRKGGITIGSRKDESIARQLSKSESKGKKDDTGMSEYPSVSSRFARDYNSASYMQSPPRFRSEGFDRKYAPSAPPFDPSNRKSDSPFHRRSESSNPYVQPFVPTNEPPKAPVRKLKDGVKLLAAHAIVLPGKVFTKEINNEAVKKYIEKGKDKLKRVIGARNKKVVDPLDLMKTGQGSHTGSPPYTPSNSNAQYAPSAPFEPSSPRPKVKSPRRLFHH